ncbi:MAG TPA: hypothetical protein VEU08_14520 [Vicinamibacterales bacterium]|nr:hypothetical protein [Vicinamibacterales bacterium]
MLRRIASIAALLVLTTAGVRAQELIGTAAPSQTYRPGWTFTPTIGVGETYDDNITLFASNTIGADNADFVRTIFPEADLHFSGQHTQFGTGYTGGFLDYQTFNELNRWDQHARAELTRQESAHLKWFAHGDAAWLPTTDLIDLAGIPFRHNGARTLNARAGAEYILDSRNAVTTSWDIQQVTFERPDDASAPLVGGHMMDSLSTWRHRLDERLAVGADYSYRRAYLMNATDAFDLHVAQAAVDYVISSEWTLSAGGGFVYLPASAEIASRTGPAYRASVDRHREGRSLHVGYERSYIPAFGIGGVVANQEVRGGFRMPVFNSRRFYSDTEFIFRDDQPLSVQFIQLPMRSLRAYTVIGWMPQPWVHIEGFYTRTDQTSLQPGGRFDRNQIGFQIVTSKPMRIE